MPRSLERETAFKLIYSKLFIANVDDKLNVIDDVVDSSNGEFNFEYAKQIVNTFSKNYSEINQIITNALKNGYKIERLNKVDLSLICLAITEIKYLGLEKKIVINEVLELSKKYSDEKSSKFINGVLASILN